MQPRLATHTVVWRRSGGDLEEAVAAEGERGDRLGDVLEVDLGGLVSGLSRFRGKKRI